MLVRRHARFGPAPKTSNPFVDARREWEDRYDRLVSGRRNWQIFALVLLVLDLLLTAALFSLSSRSRITPYVVEVDRHGHALAFGPAERLRDPDERILRYELATFIHDLRTIYAPGDEPAQKQALARLHAHLRPPATARVAAWFNKNNPFAPVRTAVSVEVTSVLGLEKYLWQVEWNEIHHGRDGSPLKSEPWQAVLSVAIDPPVRSDSILTNPLGIYVVNLDWTNVPTKEKN